jgi:RNA polymerase sigma-70 factor (sigma-E family)
MHSVGTLAAVARGNEEEVSIETLYRAHGTRLVRMARMFVADRSAAEDLVQEAFIRFHRARDRLHDPAAAVGYLRATVLNLARDHNRRGLMSLRHIDAHPIGSMGPDPDDAALLEDDEGALLEALQGLSPRQRSCVVLRYYLELSYEEMASTLGISANSVKTHLKRGMAALRERMEERR